MDPETKDQLESVIHRQLRDLPELAAPSTLLPRVLAVVRARAALPWWRRSWWEWPVPAQTGFATLVTVTLAVLLYFGLPLLTDWSATASASAVGRWLASAVDSVRSLQPLASASASVWRAAQPLVMGLLLASTLLYLMCVGLGTMFLRLAFRRI